MLLGFNESDKNCGPAFFVPFPAIINIFAGSSTKTIALLVVGFVMLLAAGVNEAFTNRSPIVPPRLFQVRIHMFIHLEANLNYLAIDADNYDFAGNDFLACGCILRCIPGCKCGSASPP